MNRISTLFFLCFFSTFLYSQKIVLAWKGSTAIDFGTEQKKVPFFSNEGFSYDSNSVYFTLNQRDSEKKLKVQNLSWEKISKKDLFDLDAFMVPDHEDKSAGVYFNKYDNTSISSVKVSALKQEKNELYRLISFEIVPDNTPEKRVDSRSGTTDNPLKTGTFYKIKVDKSGIFKITSQFLKSNGIPLSSVNPKNFRIYGNGGYMLPEFNGDFRFPALQENAIQVVGQEDGVWNDQDYALFYAQGPNGYNLYSNSNGNGNKRTETRIDPSNNVVNVYDDYSYYFINFDLGEGLRVQDMDVPVSGTPITRYDEFQVLNEEKNSLMKVGRVWVGDAFNSNKEISFKTLSPIQPDDLIRYKVSVAGFESQSNKMTFTLNNNNLVTITGSDKAEFYLLPYSGTTSGLSGTDLKFNLSPSIAANPNGRFYLNYAEVQYREDLKYNGKQLQFRDYSIQENINQNYSFLISNTTGMEQVWDVSDITRASRKVNKSGTAGNFSFGYQAGSTIFNNEFVAFNQASAYIPSFVGKIANQDLAGLQNIDYLMITSTEMMGHAQRLANYYNGQYNVAVVDVNKIYNEFSSGRKDVTAIRDFARYLNASGGLKYIFILGDSSYDYRGRSAPGSDIVPAYQSEESSSLETSFVTDDYYGMTRPQNSGNPRITSILPDIPVGRLPAANLSEARLLIDKTLAYYNALPGQSTPFGEWRMKLDFVVDDDDNADGKSGGTPFHNTVNKALVDNFETGTARNEYNVRKLYLDAFVPEISSGGQRFPQVNQAISNDISNSLFMFYFGHGGITGWAQERVLTSDQVDNLSNYNSVYSRFPVVSTITCEFTLWDNPAVSSAGEKMIKSSQGGAATMITSSRKIGISYGVAMTGRVISDLFAITNDSFQSLGDGFLKAKINYGPSDTNHLRVNFLGDPATRMVRPKRLIEIKDIPGQLRALDFVKIKGQVNKTDGSMDTAFNGRISINIFDKKLDKETRNNDNHPNFANKLKYKEEGSPIVKASGTVVNGIFTVEFYVPKDINYEMGEGRILAYADNKVTDVFESRVQTVGGINPDGINDNTPPNVKLYMNNTNFASGGITDQNPTLLACVTDDKGINSTGSGVGHDITTYLDGEIINTIVLNDFYFAGESNGCVNPSLADYQKGVVTYPFRNLKAGEHQLTFKVWDINNNSRTETLHFIVKDEKDNKLVLNRLLNWPNPFTNKTYIQFEHNCDDILAVNVQIYTITGKLVRTLSTSVTAEPFMEGFRTPRTAIEWDGRDDFGDTVAKGTYIFKVFAKGQNPEKCVGSATGVEKMVLLK